mgnify:CR=1 FL=1
MSAILDPDELLTRLAQLIKRVIDYRIFGIALLDDDSQALELKVMIKYGDDPRLNQPIRLGEGLVGYAALHKEVVLVPDVTKDPRYINAVPGVRSELVVPLIVKEKCIGDGECVDVCPVEVYELQDGKAEPVNMEECLGCESCVEVCEQDAITIEEREADEFDEAAVEKHLAAQGKPAPVHHHAPAPSAPTAHHHGGGGCPGCGVRLRSWRFESGTECRPTG